ncbi:hypothetical protein HDR58_00180 [bacterium]|nr:hypothetical protein [bacterium]
MINRVGLDQIGQYRAAKDINSASNKRLQEAINDYNDINTFVDEDNNENTKTPKKSKSAKENIAGIWKFLTSANQMIGSAIKGLIYGAITGSILLSGSWLFKSLPKAFTKEGPKLWDTIRHPIQHIGKSGKIMAGTASAIVLGYHLVKGKLEANQKTAVIDHKLKTGHRD